VQRLQFGFSARASSSGHDHRFTHSVCCVVIPKQEFAMLKIISAAVVAVSVMAAPAMAATIIKTHNPAVHSHVLKRSVANANARVIVVKKHHHHVRPHHHVTKRVIHHHY